MPHTVQWIDHGVEPKSKPNPAYPSGIDLDITRGRSPACLVELPYPAERCGMYVVHCLTCGMNAAITTAGRPDDPRSLKMPCQEQT